MPSTATKKRVKDGLFVDENDAPTSVVPVSSAELEIYQPDDRDLRILMDKAVTEDDWHNVFSTLLGLATTGGQVGVKAAELLMKYRFGLPAQMSRGEAEQKQPIKIIEIYRGNGISEEISHNSKPMEDTVDGDVPF